MFNVKWGYLITKDLISPLSLLLGVRTVNSFQRCYVTCNGKLIKVALRRLLTGTPDQRTHSTGSQSA